MNAGKPDKRIQEAFCISDLAFLASNGRGNPNQHHSRTHSVARLQFAPILESFQPEKLADMNQAHRPCPLSKGASGDGDLPCASPLPPPWRLVRS